MKRRVELRANPATTAAWQRRSRRRLPRKSATRAVEDERTAALRDAVAARPCLLRGLLIGGVCAGPGTPHHLHKAGAGGPTTAANLVPLCAHHNTWCEDEPLAAQALGLVVRPGIDHAEAARRRMAAGIG